MLGMVSCIDQEISFQAKAAKPRTIAFVNQAVEALVQSGIEEDVKITINTNSLKNLTLNPAKFLELQDYIVRRVESSNTRLSSKFKLGISLDINNDIRELNQFVNKMRGEDQKIHSLTDNVDFVTAKVDSPATGTVSSYLSKAGIHLEGQRSGTEFVIDNNFAPKECREAIAKQKTEKITLHIAEQTISRQLKSRISSCLKSAKSKKVAVDFIIAPKF